MDRFEGECLIWQGPVAKDGYPVATYRDRTHRIHRMKWIIKHGDLPPGQVVHHKCENKLCVNVDHLLAVSNAEHSRFHSSGERNFMRRKAQKAL